MDDFDARLFPIKEIKVEFPVIWEGFAALMSPGTLLTIRLCHVVMRCIVRHFVFCVVQSKCVYRHYLISVYLCMSICVAVKDDPALPNVRLSLSFLLPD